MGERRDASDSETPADLTNYPRYAHRIYAFATQNTNVFIPS
jgi:hypothetical protein